MSGARRLLALAVLAGLAGCQGTPRSLDNDPLVGGSPISRPPAGSLPTTPRPQDALTKGEVPPVPPPTTTTSPAALTSGAVAPSVDPRAPQVTLGGPRSPEGRAVRAESPDTSMTQPVSAMTPAATGSYEELQQQLLARGVVWQQLKMVGKDEWHFICAIPNPQQPTLRDNFEVRAAGPFGLAAMRLALEKIDQERR